MCGIVGYTPVGTPTFQTDQAFGRLFYESMIRGMHAYGIATPRNTQSTDDSMRNACRNCGQYHDSNCAGVNVTRSFDWTAIPIAFDASKPTIAHARYCQSGDWRVMENNQPLVVGNTALAMNGVIHMGTKEEYEAAFNVHCSVDNDSEIFLQRLAQGQAPEEFISEITGSFAATWLANGKLWAGRNARRPLWTCAAYGGIWYASTEDIFRRAGFVGMIPLRANSVVTL